ncbi:MAG: sialate O-acetylesterase [Lentisphaeria bacterium]|nr:sialate O-acetylesterase [Lentisphaeria bacterium]
MKRCLSAMSLCVFLAAPCVFAGVRLPAVIASHMILQRDVPAPVWGWADAGEEVTVTFAGQTKTTRVDETGRWTVTLEPLAASSESRSMVIKGTNEIVLEDVLVGEVWLASGQSNMEWALGKILKEEQALVDTEKDNRLVRSFHVTRHITSVIPLSDTVGQWKTCAEMVERKESSAVGFFFALKLQGELGVPVAFLDSNWGGRPIENFISNEGYEAIGLKSPGAEAPAGAEFVKQLREDLARYETVVADAEKGIFRPVYSVFEGFGNAQNGIYNAMIAPLAPFAIRGAIWYQGESNRTGGDYFEKLRALSAGWSKAFNVKDIPLYLVQIAPFDYTRGKEKNCTVLADNIWTAQYRGAEEIPGMGVIPIHDTDIPLRNIHPPSKKPVGDRLAAMALKRLFGKDVPDTGPRFESAALKDGKVIVRFKDVDQGLSTKDGKAPTWFELSEDGETFVSARAALEEDTIILTPETPITPKFVRMGWSEVAIPNLQDKNGWPAFAFPAQPLQ